MSQDERFGRLYDVLRWFVAIMMALYGFAKLNHAQFTVLDSELAKPMGTVSGFWLTWYFFGYSPVYGTAVALAQVGGALLLSIRRTALLGACVLFAVLANVVLVDLSFGVERGATVTAIALLVCVVYILAAHEETLRQAFWPPRAAADAPRRAALAWAARLVALIALPAAATWWVANRNNRAPTPLDGAWRTVAPADLGPSVPSHAYFERERAHMLVLRYRDRAGDGDRWETHHFEVEPGRRRLHAWATWLSKTTPLFEAAYLVHGDTLEVEGEWALGAVPLRWTLVRER